MNGVKRKPRKVSSKRLAAIAARILAGGEWTTREVKALEDGKGRAAV